MLGYGRLTQQALAVMGTQGGGRIVYVSSAVADGPPTVGMAAHGTAKAALNTFARFVAHEAGPLGINVNVVAPGFVRTEASAGQPVEFQQRLAEHTPLGRVAEPEDVARAISMLAGEDAGFLTGAVVTVDGVPPRCTCVTSTWSSPGYVPQTPVSPWTCTGRYRGGKTSGSCGTRQKADPGSGPTRRRSTWCLLRHYPPLDRIVLEAKRLLAHDRLTAAACANTLGFPDASNFSVFFRKATGMRPGAWQATVAVK
ncbi:SDR family oxidoreductase [Streptomyces javensis]|uniref:SDR family oxidoreductase n=1 Tax=Streptomyces javensis TaxID=114698 RepID=UPI00340891B2